MRRYGGATSPPLPEAVPSPATCRHLPPPPPCPLGSAGESLSPEEEQRAQGELEVLEAQLLDAQRLEMPRVPSGAAATVAAAARVPAAEAQVATEPAAEAASAGEPERVLVAA